MELQTSSALKLGALLHQLRSRFLEVLQAPPDFRNSKAAQDIRKDMELLIELHKQTVLEASKSAAKSAREYRRSKAGIRSTQGSKKGPIKKGSGDGILEGSYIVGGSVFGWNFVTVSGSKPVYYGETKESFRSSRTELAIH